MYVKKNHVPLAEHIVRSPQDCAKSRYSIAEFFYIGRELRPLRRSRDMPSARYVSHDISALLIRYIPQRRNVKVNFRPGRKFSYFI